jgi:hypothetical protein
MKISLSFVGKFWSLVICLKHFEIIQMKIKKTRMKVLMQEYHHTILKNIDFGRIMVRKLT